MRFSFALFLLLVAGPSPATVNDAVRVSTWGQKVLLFPGTLRTPTAIAVDSDSNFVYTVEPNRITKWTRAGNLVTSWSCTCEGVEVSDFSHHVYATSWAHDTVFEFDEFGTPVRQFGGFGSAPGQFDQPFGIAADPATGNLYVADPGNQRVQIFSPTGGFLRQITHATITTIAGEPMSVAIDRATRALWVTNPGDNVVLQFDADTGTFIRQVGTLTPALADGRFRWPRSVAVDAVGRLFVTDTDSERIQYFTRDGVFLGILQGPNNVVDGPFHPRDVAIDITTGEVFALAAYASRVDRFSATLQYELSFGQPDAKGSRFLFPRGVAASSSNGDLFIADTGNFVIKRATAGGAVLGQWGGSWNIDHAAPGLLGSFEQSALTTDADGDVWGGYVGIHYPDDPPVRFIQRFDPTGIHLSSFLRSSPSFVRLEGIVHIAVDPATRHVWAADKNGHVDHFDGEGTLLERMGSLGTPVGIALHGQYIYVADQAGFVHRLDSLGNKTTFGSPGSAPGQLQLSNASGLATDSEGNLYVADTLNHRISEFSPDGIFRGSLGQFGNEPGEFNWPRAIAFSPDYSLLHVVESATHRIQSFCMPSFALAHCFVQLDADADGHLDAADNCPFAGDASQLDSGGLNDTARDGFGDVCQCGAVDQDGIVGQHDQLLLRRYLAGSDSIPVELCSVHADAGCDLADAVVLARALAGMDPSIQPHCPAARRPS